MYVQGVLLFMLVGWVRVICGWLCVSECMLCQVVRYLVGVLKQVDMVVIFVNIFGGMMCVINLRFGLIVLSLKFLY